MAEKAIYCCMIGNREEGMVSGFVIDLYIDCLHYFLIVGLDAMSTACTIYITMSICVGLCLCVCLCVCAWQRIPYFGHVLPPLLQNLIL